MLWNVRASGGGKRCNCLCFEIGQEMDTILLIIGIVYGVCRIVIKSVQQCTYFLFSVNLLLVGVNYGQRTMQVCSYRHAMCFRASSVFVLSILFWFPQRTHYFWFVFRFLFMEHKQDYSVTSVKDVKVCF